MCGVVIYLPIVFFHVCFAPVHVHMSSGGIHTTQSSGAFCAGNSDNPPAKVPLVTVVPLPEKPAFWTLPEKPDESQPVTVATLPDEPDESQPPVMAEPVPTQPPVEVPDTLTESQFQDAQSRHNELLFPNSPSKGCEKADGVAPSPSGSALAPPVAAPEEEESEPGDSVSAAPATGPKKRDPNDFKLLGVPTMI